MQGWLSYHCCKRRVTEGGQLLEIALLLTIVCSGLDRLPNCCGIPTSALNESIMVFMLSKLHILSHE